MQNICQLFSKSTIAIIRIRAGLTCPPWLSTHFNGVGSEVQHELEGCWICSSFKKCSRKKHGEGTDARYTQNRAKTWKWSEKFKKKKTNCGEWKSTEEMPWPKSLTGWTFIIWLLRSHAHSHLHTNLVPYICSTWQFFSQEFGWGSAAWMSVKF